MNKVEKLAVVQEFEKFLTSRFGSFQKEVTFKDFMNTSRRYRADYLCFDAHVIIEINGGQWTGGRHTRAGSVKGKKSTQYEEDLNKINIAQSNGFKVYQYTYEMLKRKDYKGLF